MRRDEFPIVEEVKKDAIRNALKNVLTDIEKLKFTEKDTENRSAEVKHNTEMMNCAFDMAIKTVEDHLKGV